MSKFLMQVIPMILGGFIGYVVVAQPDWFKAMGIPGWAIGLVGGMFLLGVLFFFLILANLPKHVHLTSAIGFNLRGEMLRLVQIYTELGLEPVGPPMQINTFPPAILVGMVDPTVGVYGTVFIATSDKDKVHCDFITILEIKTASGKIIEGGLTTGRTPAGASLPVSPGAFAQVIKDATPQEMYRQHLLALDFLDGHEIKVKAVSADTFEEDICNALPMQRRAFLANPLANLVRVVWRSVTGITPHNGPLASQAIAHQQIEKLMGREL